MRAGNVLPNTRSWQSESGQELFRVAFVIITRYLARLLATKSRKSTKKMEKYRIPPFITAQRSRKPPKSPSEPGLSPISVNHFRFASFTTRNGPIYFKIRLVLRNI
jgi:hypothetical protein